MIGHPSAGAVLIPDHGVEAACELLERALKPRGYVTWPTPLPSGYRPATDEWIAGVATQVDEPAVALLIMEALDRVFHTALWVSEIAPEQPLAAYRRFLGTNPVLKFFIGGQPRWKDGEDADLEVAYPVPYEPPVGFLTAEDAGLPANAGDAAGDLWPALRSYPEAAAHPAPHERPFAWLHRSSPLLR